MRRPVLGALMMLSALGTATAAQAADEKKSAADWSTHKRTDPVTDTQTVGITKPSDNLYVAPDGQKMPAILLLMCKSHLTLAVVSFDGLVVESGLGSAIKVQHRIDEAPVQEDIFIPIGGPSQVGITGKYTTLWIKRLLKGRRLLVRVPIYPSSYSNRQVATAPWRAKWRGVTTWSRDMSAP